MSREKTPFQRHLEDRFGEDETMKDPVWKAVLYIDAAGIVVYTAVRQAQIVEDPWWFKYHLADARAQSPADGIVKVRIFEIINPKEIIV